MFRRNLGTGGQLTEWVWRRPIQATPLARRPVRHLGLDGAPLAAAAAVRPGAVGRVRGQDRIVRVRDAADPRDPAAARPGPRPRAGPGRRHASTTGPAGPGSANRSATFNQHWARRTLRTSGVVIVVSDGWDRGDPALVASETARLRRNCHRLVWLNPLAGTPGYQPLAGGMRAAFPYIDDFLPAGTVAQPRAARRDPRRCARRRHAPGQRGAPRHAAVPGARRPGRRRRTPGDLGGTAVRSDRQCEADCDEGTARHARDAGRQRAPTSAGRWSCARSGPRRGPRAPCSCTPTDGRIAGSVSGGCVEGAAAEEIEQRPRDRQRPRHPLRDQRRAGVGRRAGLRRHDRRPRASPRRRPS